MDTVKLLKAARVYAGMLERCYKENSPAYKDYGGRGIDICEEWLNHPGKFFEWCDVSGEIDGLACDRIDNNKGYSPENCRWATALENNRNRRNTFRVTAFGETKTLVEWTDDPRAAPGLSWKTLRDRIVTRGWDVETAITDEVRELKGTGVPIYLTAFGETKNQAAWVRDSRCLTSKNTLYRRIKDGWDHEKAITTPSKTNPKKQRMI